MPTAWHPPVIALHRTLFAHQPLLTRFAWWMVACMLPAACLLVLDERTWRDVAIWAKPLKFMASSALFAATTAWCVSLLPEAQRGSRAVRLLAWTVVLTAGFEVGYISLQAALGEGSHHNVADPLHAALFGLMAVAAVLLTGTQAVLAWLIGRHSADRSSTLTQSVVVGLALTFVLATVSGFLLGGQQPPAGAGLPLVGWHLGGPDARPAHFLGVHAQQLLPLAGWMLQQGRFRHPGAGLVAVTVGYVGLWALLMRAALA